MNLTNREPLIVGESGKRPECEPLNLTPYNVHIEIVITLYKEHCGRIVPVEVKAGKTGRLRPLWQFVAEKDARLALRFNADKSSLLDVTDTMHDGSRIAYRLLSLPLYLIDHANRLVDDAT